MAIEKKLLLGDYPRGDSLCVNWALARNNLNRVCFGPKRASRLVTDFIHGDRLLRLLLLESSRSRDRNKRWLTAYICDAHGRVAQVLCGATLRAWPLVIEVLDGSLGLRYVVLLRSQAFLDS